MIREEQVRALVAAFGLPIRDHYRGAAVLGLAPEADRVLEVLNALAVSTATVLAGTGADPRAVAFFLEALENQVAALQADLAAAPSPPPH